MSEKISQNIQDLVCDIGEMQVLLRLALLCHQCANWQVFKNIGDSGFDIVLTNNKFRKRVAIEVKSRQRLFTTSKRKNVIHFTLTKKECDSSDFLIAYYIDRNWMFIVPKKELRSVSSGRRWRFTVTVNRAGGPDSSAEKFLNAWQLLSPGFKGVLPSF